jgi:hypothetical protein
MSAVIEAPIEMVEAVAGLHLPPRADQRLHDLMDRNNNQRPRTRLESQGTHDHYDDAKLWSTVSCECEDG